jgi:hypothetical protein
MATVTICCPTTGEHVSTGINVDWVTWAAIPVVVSRMSCPACGCRHAWSKLEARLVEVYVPPEGRRREAA